MLSTYGSFRNVKFTDVFPDFDTFNSEITQCEIPLLLAPSEVKTLYYLLYARYGNSTIASSDENRFEYNLFAIVFQYGPTWSKKLEIQEKLRGLTEDELIAGSKSIYNHSYNPSTEPSTSTLEELTTINEQNTTNYKKSKIEAYSMLYGLLENDVTGEFLNRFKSLFLTIVNPELPLWYETEIKED